MANVHGIASLETSRHLTEEKWNTNADRLIDSSSAFSPPPSNRREPSA